jgi:hypothetical protein
MSVSIYLVSEDQHVKVSTDFNLEVVTKIIVCLLFGGKLNGSDCGALWAV